MAQRSATIAIVRDKKILLLRRGKTAKWKAGCYCLPGGKLKGNESLKDGALRELMEETGILLYRDNITPVTINYDNNYTKIVFAAKMEKVTVKLNWEHDHYIWYDVTSISKTPLVPNLDVTIKTLVDQGWLF